MEENEISTFVKTEENMKFSCKGFKAAALKDLKGKWKPLVLMSLFITAIMFCITLLFMFYNFYITTINKTASDPAEVVIRIWIAILTMMLIYSLILPVLILAYTMVFSVIKKGIKPDFSHFFSGFSYWAKGIGSFWWLFLWLFLWALAGITPGIILTIIMAIRSKGSLTLIETGLIITYIIMFAVMIIKNYQYSQHYFVIADDPSVKVTQALNISKKITKGFKWKLFVLDLSFIGWYFLFAIVWFCCFMIVRKSTAAIIGAISILSLVFSLFFLPYYMASKFNAFKWLMKRNEEKQSVLIEQKPGV